MLNDNTLCLLLPAEHYLSGREQAVALALRSRRTLLQRIVQGLMQAFNYCRHCNANSYPCLLYTTPPTGSKQ
jgi:hypothetical protein